METRRIEINYTEYTNKSEMPAEEAALLARAEEMTASSYAPYSNFHVGAAVLRSLPPAEPAVRQWLSTRPNRAGR